MADLRVVHLGLGPIGLAVARQIASRGGFSSVGAVDVDRAKVGRQLAEFTGARTRRAVVVSADLDDILRRAKPDVVVHCTGSSIRGVLPQIRAVLDRRVPLVSTTEELSYPWRTHRREAAQIDRWAREAGVGVLATGVNPGFAMDTLPLVLSAACARVERVTVTRVQDARIRRLPFQRKIGAGLSRAEFARRVEAGTVRHVGLAESIGMMAAAFGWRLDRVTDQIRPKMARVPVASDALAVARGQVCGIVQDGVGYRGGAAVIRLHMEAYLGAPETFDAVDIDGEPSLSMKVSGGIHGDIATASIVLNSIPRLIGSAPGLHTMRDLPLPSFFSGLSFR